MIKTTLLQIKKKYSVNIVIDIIKIIRFFLIITSINFIFLSGNAQNKMLLDDVDIQGQILNDEQLSIHGRQTNELNNYVEFRTNYRKRIIEELPVPEPKVSY